MNQGVAHSQGEFAVLADISDFDNIARPCGSDEMNSETNFLADPVRAFHGLQGTPAMNGIKGFPPPALRASRPASTQAERAIGAKQATEGAAPRPHRQGNGPAAFWLPHRCAAVPPKNICDVLTLDGTTPLIGGA